MRRALPALLAALGAVLADAGVAVFWLANTRRWTVHDGSYPPLRPGSAYESRLALSFDDDRWTVLWTGGHLTGALLLVAGLLVLARRAAGGSGAGAPAVSLRSTSAGVSSLGVSSRRRIVAWRGSDDRPSGTETRGSRPDLRGSLVGTA